MINIKNKLNSNLEAVRIYQLIHNAGGEIRFIGGCVRDYIVSRAVSDIDLATNLSPEEVQSILNEHKIKYYLIGKEFGTVTAVINGKPIEITTLRKDLACDGRYAKIAFTKNWQEDAQRRDFTVNALSADLEGNIYDYFDGIKDLSDKRIRFIGNAEERIKEDYLRILRFFRFSAYFSDKVDEDGLTASIKHASNLKKISASRIKSELDKIFTSPNASSIIKIMTPVLNYIIPYNIIAINQLDRLDILAKKFNCEVNPILYFAILLLNCEDSKLIEEKLAFTNNEKQKLKLLMQNKVTNWEYKALKQYWQKYKKSFKDVMLLNMVIYQPDLENNLLTSSLEKLFLHSIQILPINGNDLIKLGINPGKSIGKLLTIADQIWYDKEFNITKDQLLEKILL
jgi:poly(A) polymerase